MTGKRAPVFVRLWAKVDMDGPTPPGRPDLGPCWVWTAGTAQGYGILKIDGRSTVVYRWLWQEQQGPVPPGMTLDHLCRNRRCVRGSHLEVVTRGENVLRGNHPTAVAWRAGTCTHGHPRTPENAYERKDRPGRWNCRQCRRDRRETQPR